MKKTTTRVMCDGSTNEQASKLGMYKNSISLYMPESVLKKSILLDANIGRAFRSAVDYVYDNFCNTPASIKTHYTISKRLSPVHRTVLVDNATLREINELCTKTGLNCNRLMIACLEMYYDSEFTICDI